MLQVLLSLSDALLRSNDLGDGIRRVLTAMLQVTSATQGLAEIVIEQDGIRLEETVASGIDAERATHLLARVRAATADGVDGPRILTDFSPADATEPGEALAALAMPIRTRNAHFGTIALFGTHRAHFADLDPQFLDWLGLRVGLAFQRLYERGRGVRLLSQLEVLRTNCAMLTAEHNVKPLVEAVALQATELLGLASANVLLRLPDGERAAVASVAGDGGVAVGAIVTADPALAVACERGAVHENDPARDPRLAGSRLATNGAPLMVVPLAHDGEVIGFLVLRGRPGRRLSDQDFSLANALADQAAIAIHNARVHERMTSALAHRATAPQAARQLAVRLDGLATQMEQLASMVDRLHDAAAEVREAAVQLVEAIGTASETGPAPAVAANAARHVEAPVLRPARAGGASDSVLVPLPSVLQRVLDETDAAQPDLDKLSLLVTADEALVVRVIRYANSAALARRRAASRPREAVLVLGALGVRNATLAHFAASLGAVSDPIFRALWEGSTAAAFACRLLADAMPGVPADDAYLCGLLCDVGKMLLARANPDRYVEIVRAAARDGDVPGTEHAAFGRDHAQVGSEALAAWGLSPFVAEVARVHHEHDTGGAGRVPWLARTAALGEALGYRFAPTWRRVAGLPDHGEPAWIAEGIETARARLAVAPPAVDLVTRRMGEEMIPLREDLG